MFKYIRLFFDKIHGIISCGRKNYCSLGSFCSDRTVLFISVLLSLFVLGLIVCSMAPNCPVLLIPFLFLFCWYFISKLFKFLEKTDFMDSDSGNKVKFPWKISAGIFCFYAFMLYLDGIVRSADTIGQWQQVMAGRFNDWHPVIHTYTLYLFAKIVPEEWFVLVCFIVIFALLCGWFIQTLREYRFKSSLVLLISLLLIFSPRCLYASRFLTKDSAFALAILYLSTTMIHLWYTDGKWLSAWRHSVPTVLVLVYAAFVRHNGIFFVVPFLLFLPLLSENKERRKKLILFSCLTFLCLGGYLAGRTWMIRQNIIGSNKVQTFGESVGLPMSMLSEAFVSCPEKVPQETADFLLKIAPREKWEQYYTGDFNSVKFETYPQSSSVFLEITPGEFFTLFLKTVKACPGPSVKAFRHVSEIGWDPFSQAGLNLAGGDCGFVYRVFGKTGMAWILYSAGLYVLLLILSGTYSFLKNRFRPLFMILPFVAYSYGTSLLLSGPDHRFFWAVTIASPCIILTLMASGRVHSEQEQTKQTKQTKKIKKIKS